MREPKGRRPWDWSLDSMGNASRSRNGDIGRSSNGNLERAGSGCSTNISSRRASGRNHNRRGRGSRSVRNSRGSIRRQNRHIATRDKGTIPMAISKGSRRAVTNRLVSRQLLRLNSARHAIGLFAHLPLNTQSLAVEFDASLQAMRVSTSPGCSKEGSHSRIS